MLVVKRERRVEHPSEPGTWFTVRTPLSVGDMAQAGDARNLAEVKLFTLATALTGWSYDAPISRDTVGSLDLETFQWLSTLVFEESRLREEEEKNASGSSSGPTMAQGVEHSRPSSGI